MGPYSRVHRDYKVTSEYAILHKNDSKICENNVSNDSIRSSDEKKIN